MQQRRVPYGKRQALRAISVARTLEAPQPDAERFLSRVGRDLGQMASIRTLTSTRVTLLESGGVKRAMLDARSQPREVSSFSYRMSHYLDNARTRAIDVTINPRQPLRIMGAHRDKLVLNLISDDNLEAERERTENFLVNEFGKLPRLKSFEPHITIGVIGMQGLTQVEVEHPEVLLSPETAIPETVALNGLTVFLDGKSLKH